MRMLAPAAVASTVFCCRSSIPFRFGCSGTGISVTFHGAAQTVTGSMHLVETPAARILLDCGLMLGQREEVHRRNAQFPFAPSWIDAVLLSHAHIDHCGNLPNLVRQGFT